MVYARRLDIGPGTLDQTLYQLPVTFGGARQQSFFYSITGSDSDLRIAVHSLDGSAVGDGDYLDQYRYIIIPGGEAAGDEEDPGSGGIGGISSRSIKDYESMSYKEITTLFNIPE